MRNQISLKEHLPAYLIFQDKVLNEMAIREPITEEEFNDIPGVGKIKAKKYGRYFIECIRKNKGL